MPFPSKFFIPASTQIFIFHNLISFAPPNQRSESYRYHSQVSKSPYSTIIMSSGAKKRKAAKKKKVHN